MMEPSLSDILKDGCAVAILVLVVLAALCKWVSGV